MSVQGNSSETLVDLLYENSISQTRAGWIIPTISGSLSFLSSALIMYIIARSQGTIYTATYHRIMVCLCLSDMVSSLAILLTTLPMPKDVNEVYNFDGNSYGTTLTCEIQASSYLIGSGTSYLSSIFLSFYYVLTIRYNVTHRVMSRYVEPLSFIIFLIAIGMSSYFIIAKSDILNPVPFISWCLVGNYPYGCYQEDGESCIRGKVKVQSSSRFKLLSAVGAVMQFIFMALIISAVYKREKESSRIAQVEMEAGEDEETKREDEKQVAKHRDILKLKMDETKIAALQAFLYFASFAVTYSFIPHLTSKSHSVVLQVTTLILKPLQGFFNAMIFIYHKVYVIRHRDEFFKTSICDAITAVLKDPGSIPSILLEMPPDANRISLELNPANVKMMLEPRKLSGEGCSESNDNKWSVCGKDFNARSVSSGTDLRPVQMTEARQRSKNNDTGRDDKSEMFTDEPISSHNFSIGANEDSVFSSVEKVNTNNLVGEMYEENPSSSHALSIGANDDSVLSFAETVKKNNWGGGLTFEDDSRLSY